MKIPTLFGWPNIIIGCVFILLLWAIETLCAAVQPMNEPWVVIVSILTFTAGSMACLLFVDTANKSELAIMALIIALSFAVGNLTLKVTGLDLIEIVDAKIARAFSTHRLATAPNRMAVATWQSPRPPDQRSRDEIKNALRQVGFTYSPNYNPYNLLEVFDERPSPHPLTSPSNSYGGPQSVTLGCSEGDQRDYPIYRKDRYGFNNDDTVYAYHNLDMVVGGSFALGSCVHQEETIQGIMRQNGYPAISTGFGQAGAIAALAALKEYGETYRPNAVLWQFYDPNDIALLKEKELRSRFLLNYLQDGFTEHLIHRQDEIDTVWHELASSIPNLGEYKGDQNHSPDWDNRLTTNLPFVQELLGKNVDSLQDESDILQIYERVFAIAKQRVASWGGRIYLVMIPNEDIYSKQAIPTYQRHVQTIMSRLGIETIDVDRAIRDAGGDPLRFFADPQGWSHFNAAGYRVMTEEIMRRLELDRPLSRAATGAVDAAK